MTTKWAARKRAQRAMPTLKGQVCQRCGSTRGLQRHHPDYADLNRFEVLCRPCHGEADVRDGHRKTKQPKACKVCGNLFMPSHSQKHSTCSRECLSEVGRRNAEKRWRPLGQVIGSKASPAPRTE